MNKIISFSFFISLIFSAHAQNSTYDWRHTCNCGAGELLTKDASGNTYTTTDREKVIKLSGSGQTLYTKTYEMEDLEYVTINQSFYHNSIIYFAGIGSQPTGPITSVGRLFLFKTDTLGNVLDSLVIDTTEAIRLKGLYIDSDDIIHLAFSKKIGFQYHYVIATTDLDFNGLSYFHKTSNDGWEGPLVVTSNNDVYFGEAARIYKLNDTGDSLVWSYDLSEFLGGAEFLEIDTNGNIWAFIDGNIYSGPSSWAANFLVKLTEENDTVSMDFSITLQSSTVYDYTPQSLKVDYSDNSVWVYSTYYFGSPYNSYLRHYDESGELIGEYDQGYMFAWKSLIDSQHNLLVCGGNSDYMVKAFSPNASLLYTLVYSGQCFGGGSNDSVHDALFDEEGRLVVTGSACEGAGSNWATTLKYTLPFVTSNPQEVSKDNWKVFPVPAENQLFISGLPKIQRCVLVDESGRSFSLTPGADNSLNIRFLPQGVYFLSAVADGVEFSTTIVKK